MQTHTYTHIQVQCQGPGLILSLCFCLCEALRVLLMPAWDTFCFPPISRKHVGWSKLPSIEHLHAYTHSQPMVMASWAPEMGSRCTVTLTRIVFFFFVHRVSLELNYLHCKTNQIMSYDNLSKEINKQIKAKCCVMWKVQKKLCTEFTYSTFYCMFEYN